MPVLPPLGAARKLSVRDHGSSPAPATIIVGSVVLGIVLLVFTYVLLRFLRRQHPNPKYVPTPFLKRLWTNWSSPSSGSYQLSPGDEADAVGGRHQARELNTTTSRLSRPETAAARLSSSTTTAAAPSPTTTSTTTTANGVDRNTSIRSVLTLPAYRTQATDSEQVLGREGDRDGVDVVVELPTAEEEEAMRDEEMDALYQIRLARRRQVAEREERRQRRREARERRDRLAVEELRAEVRAASASHSQETEGLRSHHEQVKQARQRAVSSVSYHDVGIARHDGTRIRANSSESERVGLLSDAASIALSTQSGGDARRGSTGGPTFAAPSPFPSPGGSLFHRRDPSAGSVLSVDTGLATTADRPGSPLTHARSRADSGLTSTSPRLSGSSSTRPGSVPPQNTDEADVGEAEMPLHSPPGYDDVSLDDGNESFYSAAVTPAHSRGGSQSGAHSPPYNEPPPDYPGPTQRRNRLSANMAASEQDEEERRGRHGRQGSADVPRGLTPHLPSLRLAQLPQIVIDPARQGDEER